LKITNMESFTPRSLISGRIKAERGQERETAAAAAAAVLGSESIALIYSRSQGDIWYLAAPAADLASHPASTTPLAAALPGAQGHEGDGAYLTDLSAGWQAVIVKNGDNLHSFVGTPAMVQRFAILEGAQASHTCTAPGMPWQFPSEVSQRREARLRTALTASALVVALLAAGTWLWAAHEVSQQIELRDVLRQEHLKAWTIAVRSLAPLSYPKALADLQKAIAQAIREKGVLVNFEYRDGRSTWTLNVNNRVVTGAAN
jgi:hypothetical protein